MIRLLVGLGASALVACSPLDDFAMWPGMSYAEIDAVRDGAGSALLAEYIDDSFVEMLDIDRFAVIDPATGIERVVMYDARVEFSPWPEWVRGFHASPQRSSDNRVRRAQGRSILLQLTAWGLACDDGDIMRAALDPSWIVPADIDICAPGASTSPQPFDHYIFCLPQAGIPDVVLKFVARCMKAEFVWSLSMHQHIDVFGHQLLHGRDAPRVPRPE